MCLLIGVVVAHAWFIVFAVQQQSVVVGVVAGFFLGFTTAGAPGLLRLAWQTEDEPE